MGKYIKGFLLLALLVACWVIALHYVVDLIVLYDTGHLVHRGEYERIYSASGVNGSLSRFFYGPITLILLNPMAFASLPVVQGLWIGLQTAAFVVFWIFLAKLYPFIKEPKIHWTWIVVFIVAINPIHNNFQSNNIQLMIAAVLLYAEYLSRQKSEGAHVLAGALSVLVAAIKIFPLFMVGYFFLTKSRAVKRGIIGGAAVILILPFLYFGPSTAWGLYRAFVINLTSYDADNSLITCVDICCLPSLIARLLVSAPAQVTSLVTKALVLVISLGFYAYSYLNRRQANPTHLFALAFALMAFLTPSTRPHYYIFYVPAFCCLAEKIREKTKVDVWAVGTLLSAALIALTQEGVTGHELNEKLEAWSFPTYGMMIAVAMVAYLLAVETKKRRLA